MVVGRLAPTPSGHLHLGNTCSFLAAWLSVRQAHGELLLRVEDVDSGRARAEFAESQRTDLQWLGLNWDREVPRQSARDYAPWLQGLGDRAYRCTCSRKTRQAREGADPCRTAGHVAGSSRFQVREATAFTDRRFGLHQPNVAPFSDPVLRRADGVYAYNLAVVADDIADGVTEVVRGADLLDFTAVQVQLFRAFDATPPSWLHAPLVVDKTGRKLAKSHGDVEIRALRRAGWTAEDVLSLVLPWLGLSPQPLERAARSFDPTAGSLGPIAVMVPSHTPSPGGIDVSVASTSAKRGKP